MSNGYPVFLAEMRVLTALRTAGRLGGRGRGARPAGQPAAGLDRRGDCPGKTELEGAAVFVEYTPQTRVEGEMQALEPDFPVTELGRCWSVAAPAGSRTTR